jgi:hypothetical protein
MLFRNLIDLKSVVLNVEIFILVKYMGQYYLRFYFVLSTNGIIVVLCVADKGYLITISSQYTITSFDILCC